MDSAAIRSLAQEKGFALCGVAPADPSSYEAAVREWIDAGKHGEMDWLAENLDKRLDPSQLLAGARAIIVVADRLPNVDEPTDVTDGVPGRIARYAQVSDYHKVIKKRLFALADALRQTYPDDAFKVCVDTVPLLEREHAMRSGVGWTGKHTLLISPTYGSHVMLGAIVTTANLKADTPQTDHCGTCTRCIDACPTDCITPYSLDATRCISYLTIEHRGRIDPKFLEPIGEWIYGCDICQDVCPFVQSAAKREPLKMPDESYETHSPTRPALEVLGWSEQDRREAFIKSPMKRAKLEQMRRNALIVIGNALAKQADPSIRSRIEQVAENVDESEVMRQTAQDVLNRLAAD
jgi:epoxyqueuosine reductase